MEEELSPQNAHYSPHNAPITVRSQQHLHTVCYKGGNQEWEIQKIEQMN